MARVSPGKKILRDYIIYGFHHEPKCHFTALDCSLARGNTFLEENALEG
jgi:hypothetical protein